MKLLHTKEVRSFAKRCFTWYMRVFGTRRDAVAAAYYASQAIAEEHWRTAIDYAELAITADPAYPDGHRVLGRAYLRSGDPIRARAAYEAGARLAPNDVNLAWALGDLELTSERYEAAEAAYRRAVSLKPDDPVLLSKVAQALGAQDRVDEAAVLLERALELAPGDAQVLWLLGMARCQQGNLPDAVSLLAESIERERAQPLAHYYLALALAELGRQEEAVAAVRLAVALDAGNEQFRALQAQLVGAVDPFGQGGDGQAGSA